MALTGKTVSAKSCIYRAIRDSDLKAVDFNLGTMLEWIGEALDLIGCPYSYVNKIACIDIEDYRGTLPCDMVEINQASALTAGGIQYPMRVSNNPFHPLFFNQGGEMGISFAKPIAIDAQGNPVFNFANQIAPLPTFGGTNVAGTMPGATVNLTPLVYNDITYTVNDNYIFTSFKEGSKVLLAYRAFPVDDEGFPLIPDNEKFKSYLTWHLLMKTFYRQYIKGKCSREIYQDACKERDWYCGAATTAGLMPTVDQMESWRGQMLHLIPRLHEHSTMFSTLGNDEFLKMGQNWNRY